MAEKEKQKKPFYKKWWVWLIAIIIIAAIASNGGSGGSKDATSKPASTADHSSNNNEKKAETKEYKIGDLVKVGDMQYKINSKTTADQVGPSALPTNASGKFVVVDVTLKNNGDKAVTVDSSFFKLKRGGKTYEADSEASMSANQKEDGNIDNSFFAQEVNPDSEITGKVVFDVSPEVANASDLQLQVQTGAFGTETALINLQ